MASSFIGPLLGQGFGLLILLASLVVGLYLFVFAPVIAVDEGRTMPEALGRSIRAARMPGAGNLMLAALYVVPFAVIVAPGEPGSLMGVNPTIGAWVFVLGLPHVVLLAAFAFRYLSPTRCPKPRPGARRRLADAVADGSVPVAPLVNCPTPARERRAHTPEDRAPGSRFRSGAGRSRGDPGGGATNRAKEAPVPVVTRRELLEAGVHFGHQTRRWNPKMRRFLYGERSGIYIIDLEKSLSGLEETYEFVRDLGRRGGIVLFIGTKKQAQEVVAEHAGRVGMPYVNNRWLGGMLTNFTTISKRLRRLRELREMERTGALDYLPKKEAIRLRHEREKLERNLGGIQDLERAPRRGVRHRHEEGAHRRHRGAQARHPRDRDRRHELRSRRGRLRDPGQRRRHPLGHAGRSRHRRRARARAAAWRRTTWCEQMTRASAGRRPRRAASVGDARGRPPRSPRRTVFEPDPTPRMRPSRRDRRSRPPPSPRSSPRPGRRPSPRPRARRGVDARRTRGVSAMSDDHAPHR